MRTIVVSMCVCLMVLGLCFSAVRAETDRELLKLGNMLLKYEKWDLSSVEYMRLISKYPNSSLLPEAEFNLIKSLQSQGKHWLAISGCEDYIKKYPGSKYTADAKKMLTMLQWYIENLDENYYTMEDRACQKLIDCGNNSLTEASRGWPHGYSMNEKEYENAISYFDKAVKDYPNSLRAPHALWAKAQVYRNRFNTRNENGTIFFTESFRELTKKTIAAFEELIEKYPDCELAIRAMRQVADRYYGDLGDREKAKAAYQKIIEMTANLENSRDRTNAESMIYKIENSSYTTYECAEIRIQDVSNGAHTTESAAAERLIHQGNLFVNRSLINAGYGVVFEEVEIKKGLEFYDRVIKEFPNTRSAPKAMYQKAQAYTRREDKGDYKAAIQIFEELLEKYPDDNFWADRTLVRMAQLYQEKIGSIKKAIETYQKIIDKYDGDPYNYNVALAITQMEIMK